MSPSGQLPLFRGLPSEEGGASIPSWRATPADVWCQTTPSRRTVEAQAPDLLRRGLEFMQAAKGAADARRDESLRRFERDLEELAVLLVEWPDVEPPDDEAADAARLVSTIVDELGILRTRILRELDAGARERVLAAERRASSEPRLAQRIGALAEFLLAEARGDVVELHLSPSFLVDE